MWNVVCIIYTGYPLILSLFKDSPRTVHPDRQTDRKCRILHIHCLPKILWPFGFDYYMFILPSFCGYLHTCCRQLLSHLFIDSCQQAVRVTILTENEVESNVCSWWRSWRMYIRLRLQTIEKYSFKLYFSCGD